MSYQDGLLRSVERKNSYPVISITGDSTSYALQHVLGRADWERDELRDRLRIYVTADLDEAGTIWVVGATGILKQGTYSVGVRRQ